MRYFYPLAVVALLGAGCNQNRNVKSEEGAGPSQTRTEYSGGSRTGAPPGFDSRGLQPTQPTSGSTTNTPAQPTGGSIPSPAPIQQGR